LAAGTVVATLRDDKYYSDYSGRSHVGIYLAHDDYATYLSGKAPSAGLWFEKWSSRRIQTGHHHLLIDGGSVQAGILIPLDGTTFTMEWAPMERC
jgi:hypothetical protein